MSPTPKVPPLSSLGILRRLRKVPWEPVGLAGLADDTDSSSGT